MAVDLNRMILNVFLSTSGYHSGSWRRPGSRSGELLSIDVAADMTREAEQAKIHAVFIADSLGLDSARRKEPRQTELEPVTMMAALAVLTTDIGLIGTISSTFTEPFNLSRYLSSVDHISRGRAGWNIVTSTGGEHNFGIELPPHDERYARADEYINVVKALWDSWDDDAVVNDPESGFWVRPERVHSINFEGKWHRVGGPAHIPRPPQGWPVLVQAGSSTQGLAFAAKHADVVFTAQSDLEGAKRMRRDFGRLTEQFGRCRDAVKVLPGLMPIIGSTEAEAVALNQELASYVDIEIGLDKLQTYIPSVDLHTLDLDRPIPEESLAAVEEVNSSQSRYEVFATLTRERGYTLRQLVGELTTAHGHGTIVGTPEQVADRMELWVRAQACEGFNLQLSHAPGAMTAIAQGLIPELQRRGLYQRDYEGATLREHLGLPRPADRSPIRDAE